MVNFNLKLRDNIYSEWSASYLDYKKLKKILKPLKVISKPTGTGTSPTSGFLKKAQPEGTPLISVVSLEARAGTTDTIYAKVQQSFEHALEFELKKVEKCYVDRLTEYQEQFEFLRRQYRTNSSDRVKESLQNSSVELYRLLNLLNNFALLNYTGFVKIIKKHDKLSTEAYHLKSAYHVYMKNNCTFHQPTCCTRLLEELQQFYADRWCDGNASVARTSLLVKKEDPVDWKSIGIGIRIGICFILLVWVSWDAVLTPAFARGDDGPTEPRAMVKLISMPAFRVYRCVGCLIVLLWCWGSSLYVWRSARINYRYLFDFDPRTSLDEHQVFSEACNATMFYLVNILLYAKFINHSIPEVIPQGLLPLGLFVITTLRLFVPFHLRKGLWVVLLQIVASPFTEVSFFHTIVGDYLTSTVKIHQDFVWSMCYFWSGEFQQVHHGESASHDDVQECADRPWFRQWAVPLICALPLWFRFQQNLKRIRDTRNWCPHALNAFKYALAQVVALFGVVHPIISARSTSDVPSVIQSWWIFTFIFSSFFTWCWDIKMDWGLGNWTYQLLADQGMYAQKWYYYLAMVLDFFLRFVWMINLIPPHSLPFSDDVLTPATMMLELFRRTMWSYFRVENEHLRNTQGFRRVDFIPLHFDSDVGNEFKHTLATDETAPEATWERWCMLAGIVTVVIIVVLLSIQAVTFTGH